MSQSQNSSDSTAAFSKSCPEDTVLGDVRRSALRKVLSGEQV